MFTKMMPDLLKASIPAYIQTIFSMLDLIIYIKEAAGPSEMVVTLYKTKRNKMPGDNNFMM